MLPADSVTGVGKTFGVGFCAQCGKSFLHHTQDRKKRFCSNACRQKSYRRNIDPKSGSWASLRARAEKGAATKRAIAKRKVCEWCGVEYWATGNNAGHMLYCGGACKQAAYRARKGLSPTAVSILQELLTCYGQATLQSRIARHPALIESGYVHEVPSRYGSFWSVSPKGRAFLLTLKCKDAPCTPN